MGGGTRGLSGSFKPGKEKMLPREDKNMLVSVINMKLRDFYGSFEELCDDLDEDRDGLIQELESAGYRYDPATNSFR